MRNALYASAFALLSGPSLGWAQASPEEEIAALRAELEQLMERLERLERTAAVPADAAGRMAGAVAAPPERVATGAAATGVREEAVSLPAGDRIELMGDLRYRHESIDEAGARSRGRHRLRARFGAEAAVAEDLTVALVLATGGDDPVSANQTLGSGFSRKDFGVDRAYFDWRATERARVAGGKMPNPFFRPGDHHLIYDRDLNPEGLAFGYGFGGWFLNMAGLSVEERGAAEDALLLGGQMGYRATLASDSRLTTGFSYYDYRAAQGGVPFYDGAPAGNRLDPLGGYASDFDLVEAFAELELSAGGRPLVVFGDYVVNRAAAADDRGFALGASYGAVDGRGGWSFGWRYQELEPDAVVGAFADSDFGGGGSDNEGHVLEWSYGLLERWRFDARYFANRRGAGAGEERDYDRLQLDLVFDY